MLYRIRCLAVVAGLFLFISGDLFAQTKYAPRELRFGTWVPGNLREGEEHWYSVRPIETGLVTVETSGETDTYLEAYDSSRVLIDENDDYGDDFNARLEILAEAGKTYFFNLRGYDEDESGPYQIRASFSAIRELRTDTWVSGTLKDNENHWFMVRAARTGIMIVRLPEIPTPIWKLTANPAPQLPKTMTAARALMPGLRFLWKRAKCIA